MGEMRPQALSNLALLMKERAQASMRGGNLAQARTYSTQAGAYLDQAKPLFDALVPLFPKDEGLRHYATGYEQLRILLFRLVGGTMLQLREFADCEREIRRMLAMF